MYIETVPNRNSRPAILLRESHREGKRVRKRTLANLTDWPPEQVEAFRRLLKGEKLVPAGELLTIERSKPHGHVEAILRAIRKLGLDAAPVALRDDGSHDLLAEIDAVRMLDPADPITGKDEADSPPPSPLIDDLLQRSLAHEVVVSFEIDEMAEAHLERIDSESGIGPI